MIQQLTKELVIFRDKRDWSKFHSQINLALSLQIEVGELLEHFQWKTNDQFLAEYNTQEEKRELVEEEIADIFSYLLLLCDGLNIDLELALKRKIIKNSKKYPIRKAKGNSKKYTEF